MSSLTDLLVARIRRGGPMTAAAFIDLALYHPDFGYYSRAGQRSGRGGDFFTSVDVGPLFGELLSVQISECLDLLGPLPQAPSPTDEVEALNIVEAGAGNGRLMRDVLDTLEAERRDLYDRVRVRLLERSAAARAEHAGTLGPHAAKIGRSGLNSLNSQPITGVVYANELLDALPVHVVVLRGSRLREIYVAERDGALVEIEEAPSTPALQAYLERTGVALAPNGRAEINLAADDWIASAGRTIARGFLVLIDYGHEAAELFCGSHGAGTLMTFARHRTGAGATHWLREPGERDITCHVDLTSIRAAAERAGFTTLGITDQTYFLLGLGLADRIGSGSSPTLPERSVGSGSSRTLQGTSVASGSVRTTGAVLNRINQAKTLMMPGGLGSTHKVMIFGKDVGCPPLRGLSYRVRVT